MIPVPKKNGEVCICADLKRLNIAVKGERFILPTIDDIFKWLAESQVFSLLDAASTFLKIPLEEETDKLATFITAIGMFFSNTVLLVF